MAIAHDLLGHSPKQHVHEFASAMGAHDHQIVRAASDLVQNAPGRIPVMILSSRVTDIGCRVDHSRRPRPPGHGPFPGRGPCSCR